MGDTPQQDDKAAPQQGRRGWGGFLGGFGGNETKKLSMEEERRRQEALIQEQLAALLVTSQEEIDEQKRKQEALVQQALEEKKRKQLEEEAKRKQAEEDAKRKQQEEEARRKQQQEDAKRKQAELEARRNEIEAKRKEQEQQRKEEEAKQKQLEHERVQAELARIRQEQERKAEEEEAEKARKIEQEQALEKQQQQQQVTTKPITSPKSYLNGSIGRSRKSPAREKNRETIFRSVDEQVQHLSPGKIKGQDRVPELPKIPADGDDDDNNDAAKHDETTAGQQEEAEEEIVPKTELVARTTSRTMIELSKHLEWTKRKKKSRKTNRHGDEISLGTMELSKRNLGSISSVAASPLMAPKTVVVVAAIPTTDNSNSTGKKRRGRAKRPTRLVRQQQQESSSSDLPATDSFDESARTTPTTPTDKVEPSSDEPELRVAKEERPWESGSAKQLLSDRKKSNEQQLSQSSHHQTRDGVARGKNDNDQDFMFDDSAAADVFEKSAFNFQYKTSDQDWNKKAEPVVKDDKEDDKNGKDEQGNEDNQSVSEQSTIDDPEHFDEDALETSSRVLDKVMEQEHNFEEAWSQVNVEKSFVAELKALKAAKDDITRNESPSGKKHHGRNEKDKERLVLFENDKRRGKSGKSKKGKQKKHVLSKEFKQAMEAVFSSDNDEDMDTITYYSRGLIEGLPEDMKKITRSRSHSPCGSQYSHSTVSVSSQGEDGEEQDDDLATSILKRIRKKSLTSRPDQQFRDDQSTYSRHTTRSRRSTDAKSVNTARTQSTQRSSSTRSRRIIPLSRRRNLSSDRSAASTGTRKSTRSTRTEKSSASGTSRRSKTARSKGKVSSSKGWGDLLSKKSPSSTKKTTSSGRSRSVDASTKSHNAQQRGPRSQSVGTSCRRGRRPTSTSSRPLSSRRPRRDSDQTSEASSVGIYSRYQASSGTSVKSNRTWHVGAQMDPSEFYQREMERLKNKTHSTGGIQREMEELRKQRLGLVSTPPRPPIGQRKSQNLSSKQQGPTKSPVAPLASPKEDAFFAARSNKFRGASPFDTGVASPGKGDEEGPGAFEQHRLSNPTFLGTQQKLNPSSLPMLHNSPGISEDPFGVRGNDMDGDDDVPEEAKNKVARITSRKIFFPE